MIDAMNRILTYVAIAFAVVSCGGSPVTGTLAEVQDTYEVNGVAFTMKTLDPRGVQAMLNMLMMVLSGNILPLTLFPDSWQKVITLLPYAQLLDAPIRLYTGDTPPSSAPGILLIQGIWVLLLTGVGILFWRANQKRLEIQGG